MRRFKVRYNLAKGAKTYRKWRVVDPMGISTNYDPEKVTLVMNGCTLRNNKEVAQIIMDGGYKRVCAWLLCEHVEVTDKPAVVGAKDKHLMYNPRKAIHWVIGGEDMDGGMLPSIYSSGRELYIPEKQISNT